MNEVEKLRGLLADCLDLAVLPTITRTLIDAALAEPQGEPKCETMQRPKAECGCPDCGSSLIDWPQGEPTPAITTTAISVARELLIRLLNHADRRMPTPIEDLHQLRALLAEPAPAQDERPSSGVTIEKDVFGTVHIKVGDFDYVQIKYQYPYTDNSSQNVLAKRIAELLARPAQTEQQPVCWASSTALAKLRNGRNNSPCVLTDGPAEFNDTPLFAAPIAQTAPTPTGLSQGWNLVRQCDGFVIGHSSVEPKEKHKAQALLDGRIYVPFLVEQTAPDHLVRAITQAIQLIDSVDGQHDSRLACIRRVLRGGLIVQEDEAAPQPEQSETLEEFSELLQRAADTLADVYSGTRIEADIRAALTAQGGSADE